MPELKDPQKVSRAIVACGWQMAQQQGVAVENLCRSPATGH
ncbi:hypothetical protein ACNKHW_10720 [Shigella flexneri]